MKTNAKQLAAARRAMEVIAVHEGISVEEVRREISLAILKQKSKGEHIIWQSFVGIAEPVWRTMQKYVASVGRLWRE